MVPWRLPREHLPSKGTVLKPSELLTAHKAAHFGLPSRCPRFRDVVHDH